MIKANRESVETFFQKVRILPWYLLDKLLQDENC